MIKECNFKHETHGATAQKYCYLAHIDGSKKVCSGEDNCFLFQIYKLLLALPKMSTIVDWDKTNTPSYGCINCGFSSFNFFAVFDEKTGKCKNCGFKVKK